MIAKIAWRNILRNRVRSAMSGLALAAGALAMLLFGAFMISLILGVKTAAISRDGHLTIYRVGYLDYGEGSPGKYSIADYQTIIAAIRSDHVLGPQLNEITPRVSVFGVAGNFAIDASKTFFGSGFVPSARARMERWDEYHIKRAGLEHPLAMSDDDTTRGVVGVGLARVLGYCQPLHLDHCPDAQAEQSPAAAIVHDNFTLLASQDSAGSRGQKSVPQAPQLDLLAATALGAPNVVTLNIGGVSRQAAREYDDSYVGMPLALAQQLLYGRGDQKVTSIVIQLRHSNDMGAAKSRLHTLLKTFRQSLEVDDFVELTPLYKEVIALFGGIFGFIAIIMFLIVVFSVANTMAMSVMERTAEIGTLRAMGIQRGALLRQFLAEGLLLGILGASLGVVLAITTAAAVNSAGLTWIPPGQISPVPLHLTLWVYPQLMVMTWIGLIAAAAAASWLPANRAARLTIVDALRHI